ncbi:MAG: hypothetical protein ACYS14_06315 [Planctomycetota bacterium]
MTVRPAVVPGHVVRDDEQYVGPVIPCLCQRLDIAEGCSGGRAGE